MGDPFTELVDRARAEAAARSREVTRSLRRQAEESATLAGALLDLADARVEVAVTTASGRTTSGVLVLVGGDVVAVRSRRSATFVSRRAIRTVTGGSDAPVGDRAVARDLRLVDVVATLAADEAAATLHLDGGGAVQGDVLAAGVDVVAVRTEDGPRRTVVVPLDAVAEVVVAVGEVPRL